MGTDCGLRGLPLLDAVIEQIEAHPETWEQASYRCDSGMCVAGWAAEMSGACWATAVSPDATANYLLKAEAADRDGDIAGLALGEVVTAPTRARRVLEITGDEDFDLFWSGNDLAEIKRIRDEIANRMAAEK
jgi:hypothetical protein